MNYAAPLSLIKRACALWAIAQLSTTGSALSEPMEQNADKTRKLKAIERLYELTRMNELTVATLNEGMLGIANQTQIVVHTRFAQQKNLNEKERIQREKTALNFIVNQYKTRILDDAALRNEVHRVYTEILSQELSTAELDSLVSFYESPLGQKSIDVRPKLRRNIGHAIATEILPDLDRITNEVVMDRIKELVNSRTAVATNPPLRSVLPNKKNYRNMLLTPRRDISTTIGPLRLAAAKNSVVYVARNKKSIGIFNLHDSKTGDVKVKLGNHQISLWPGHVLLLTRDKNAKIENVWFLPKVGYGNVQKLPNASACGVFEADFSIPQALQSVPAFAALLKSKDEQHISLVKDIIKTAAVASIVRPKVRSKTQ